MWMYDIFKLTPVINKLNKRHGHLSQNVHFTDLFVDKISTSIVECIIQTISPKQCGFAGRLLKYNPDSGFAI